MNQTKTLQQQIGEIYRAKALIATHQAHGRRTRWTRTREIRFLFKIFSPKHPTMSKSPLFASGETLFIRVFVWSVAFFVACEFIRLFVFHQIFVFYSLCSSCPWLADSTTSFLAPFFFLSIFYFRNKQTSCRSWGTYQATMCHAIRAIHVDGQFSFIVVAYVHTFTHTHGIPWFGQSSPTNTYLLVESRWIPFIRNVPTRLRAGITFFTRLGTRLFNLCRANVEEKKWRRRGAKCCGKRRRRRVQAVEKQFLNSIFFSFRKSISSFFFKFFFVSRSLRSFFISFLCSQYCPVYHFYITVATVYYCFSCILYISSFVSWCRPASSNCSNSSVFYSLNGWGATGVSRRAVLHIPCQIKRTK